MSRVNESFAGIIMSRRDYREHDLLVKILTDSMGPLMFLVRGAKRSRSKLAAAVLPFSYGQYVGMLDPQRLSYLITVKELHQWDRIGADIDRNAYATYLLELVDHAFQEGQSIGAWYQQVERALALINAGRDPQVITNVLEVQLLGRFGVAPQWQHCVVCKRQQGPFDYSEAYGGLLCADHWELDPHRLHLGSKTVAYLQLFSTLNLQKVDQVNVRPLVKRNLRWALDKIYNDQVGLFLKSKHFIDSMNSWDQDLNGLLKK
ncbi:DNA repair protein RecO [Limosilactobacillus secaliphilus]|uniref:DNA repair protein RecO n=1 Tax=Limosilactobacillus secaliphilus TaxID=396268 RepID=A0A0R2I9Q3_9LACO|nr:DNA repair protein RecO [Limosilactobacillus secaliphilus]KRN58823.1 DNA repair protein RecO [Limosilactobacillus secaliphilus]